MEKLLKNKVLPYVFLGLFGLFEFISCVMSWTNNGFTFSGFIGLLVTLGLLFAVGFGIYRKNNTMVLFSATPLLVLSIISWFTSSEGPLRANYGEGVLVVYGVFLLIAAIALLGTLVLLYVKAFGCATELKLAGAIFGLVAALCTLIAFIVSMCDGYASASLAMSGLSKLSFALLVSVMPYSLEVK